MRDTPLPPPVQANKSVYDQNGTEPPTQAPTLRWLPKDHLTANTEQKRKWDTTPLKTRPLWLRSNRKATENTEVWFSINRRWSVWGFLHSALSSRICESEERQRQNQNRWRRKDQTQTPTSVWTTRESFTVERLSWSAEVNTEGGVVGEVAEELQL